MKFTMFISTGYGWVIVLSCFLMVMIMDGLLNAFGIIYVEVIDKFGASSSQVTWILSIQKCSLGFIGELIICFSGKIIGNLRKLRKPGLNP